MRILSTFSLKFLTQILSNKKEFVKKNIKIKHYQKAEIKQMSDFKYAKFKGSITNTPNFTNDRTNTKLSIHKEL